MEREDIRLECIKIAYAHSRDATEAVGRAKILENYIYSQGYSSEVKEPLPRKKAGRPKKKADNPDFLS